MSSMPFLDELDPVLKQEMMNFVFVDLIDDGDDKKNADSKSTTNQKVKQNRKFYNSLDYKDSNWYDRFLKNDERTRIELTKEKHPKFWEFRGLFAVPYEVFEHLVELYISNGWYNNEATNCWGKKCFDVRLLILGVLNKVRRDSLPIDIQSNTNISNQVHKVFFKYFTERMESISHNFISMPRNDEELEKITHDFEKLNLVGCCGSMDVVHIGWDACPSQLKAVYEGKEGHPTIAFQVISSHHKEIFYVSKGFPGTRNDRQIVKIDTFPKELHSGEHWLSSKEWYCSTRSGGTVRFCGMWLLVDGGYLRWPSLLCPCPRDADLSVKKLSRFFMKVRKDIEDVFGILKKRFKCLRNWSRFADQTVIRNQFVFCCIVHNLCFEFEGYLNHDYIPDIDHITSHEGLEV